MERHSNTTKELDKMFISISGGNYFSSEEMVYIIAYNSEFARAVYKTAKAEGRLANLIKGKFTKEHYPVKMRRASGAPAESDHDHEQDKRH